MRRDEGALDYRSLTITKEVMLDLAEKPPASGNSSASPKDCPHPLHESIMQDDWGFGKEENLLLPVSLLIQRYGAQPATAELDILHRFGS